MKKLNYYNRALQRIKEGEKNCPTCCCFAQILPTGPSTGITGPTGPTGATGPTGPTGQFNKSSK